MPDNAHITKQQADVKPYSTGAYDQFLTYSALAGLIVTDDGTLEKMPLYKFCAMLGVDQKTTWRWKTAPGFAMKVRARREEIVPLARESLAFNQLFLLGMQNQDKRAAVDALKTYLGHFSKLQLPVQRQDIKVEGGWAELLLAAKRDGIIEGEIVSGTTTDTATSGADTPTLPQQP